MNAGFSNVYKVVCTNNGEVKWEEEVHNLVTTEGLDHLLTSYFNGSAYTAAHYMALKTGAAITDEVTLTQFVASYEDTNYDGNRPAINLSVPEDGVEALSRAVHNNADPCLFTINGATTVTGVGVCTVDTGDAGVLFASAEFSAARPLVANDILSVVSTFTQKSY